MGTFAILRSSARAEPCLEKDDGHAELYWLAKYRVPIFWVALFCSKDIAQFVGDDLDGRPWPYLLGQREDCIAQLLKRRTNVFSVLPPTHLPEYDRFIDVLQKVRQPCLHFDTSGLSDSTPAQWNRELRDFFHALDTPPPRRIRSGLSALFLGSGLEKGWELLLLQNSIELSTPKPEDVYGLMGEPGE